MGQYDDDIATAKELIAEAGEDSVIHRLTPGVVDPDKPWLPVPSVPTEHTVSAVWLNYRMSMMMNAPDSLIKVGDKKVLVAAMDIDEISASDQIERADGERYKIEGVKLLDPNGQRILYELQVRQ
jgi:hypothetical protein